MSPWSQLFRTALFMPNEEFIFSLARVVQKIGHMLQQEVDSMWYNYQVNRCKKFNNACIKILHLDWNPNLYGVRLDARFPFYFYTKKFVQRPTDCVIKTELHSEITYQMEKYLLRRGKRDFSIFWFYSLGGPQQIVVRFSNTDRNEHLKLASVLNFGGSI